MVLEENAGAIYSAMPGLQPQQQQQQLQLPPGFAYAQPQQQQQHPTFVVMQPQPTIGTSSTPLSSQLRVLVIIAVLVASFAVVAYSWGLYAVYHDYNYDYYGNRTEGNQTLMVFVKIVFPILQGVLWISGIAVAIFPHVLLLQIFWGLNASIHSLLSLAGIVHFIVYLSMNIEVFVLFILVVWVPVLQGATLLLMCASLRVMGKYMCELRQQQENGATGAAVPMTVFANPTGAIHV